MLEKLPLIASAMLAGAAGAAAHVDNNTSLTLLGLSGLSGVVGALFWRAQERDSAITDVGVNIVAAFVFTLAAGGPIGDVGLAMLTQIGMDPVYRTALSAHIGGGVVAGALMLTGMRAASTFFGRKGGGKGK